MNYAVHDTSGRVLRFGKADDLVSQAGKGETVVRIDAIPTIEPDAAWFVRKGELVRVSVVDALTEEQARAERNRLLRDTDWTQLPDSPEIRGMKAYRQALRDLPEQDGWPIVEWPEKP